MEVGTRNPFGQVWDGQAWVSQNAQPSPLSAALSAALVEKRWASARLTAAVNTSGTGMLGSSCILAPLLQVGTMPTKRVSAKRLVGVKDNRTPPDV